VIICEFIDSDILLHGYGRLGTYQILLSNNSLRLATSLCIIRYCRRRHLPYQYLVHPRGLTLPHVELSSSHPATWRASITHQLTAPTEPTDDGPADRHNHQPSYHRSRSRSTYIIDGDHDDSGRNKRTPQPARSASSSAANAFCCSCRRILRGITSHIAYASHTGTGNMASRALEFHLPNSIVIMVIDNTAFATASIFVGQ